MRIIINKGLYIYIYIDACCQHFFIPMDMLNKRSNKREGVNKLFRHIAGKLVLVSIQNSQ